MTIFVDLIFGILINIQNEDYKAKFWKTKSKDEKLKKNTADKVFWYDFG